SALWRQLLADVMSCPIVRTQADEGPAYGAALLAGVASGMYTDVAEATAQISLRPDICEPDASTARRYEDFSAAYKGLHPATPSRRARGLAEDQTQVPSRQHRERWSRVHVFVKAEVFAVEGDRGIDVIDDVADLDCRHSA